MIEQYIGTFWRQVFKDSAFIQSLLLGTEDVYSQMDQDLTTLNNALSRHTIDPYRKTIWIFATYATTDMNQDAMLFDQDNVFFDGKYKFGDRLHNFFTLPVDPSIKKIPFILSAPTNPTIVLQDGIDYVLNTDMNLLFFRDDPFTQGFDKRFFNDSEEPVLGIAMWFYRGDKDFKDIPYIYGEPAKIGVLSSPYFKRIVNAIWDLRVEGGTITNVNKLLSAVVDTDSIETSGTLNAVFSEAGRTWAQVGDALYSAPASVSVLKTVGQEVLRGEMLFNAAVIYTGRDTISFNQFPALHLSNNFLSSEFVDGVLVENKEYPFPDSEIVVLSQRGDSKVLVISASDPQITYLISGQTGFELNLLVQSEGGTYKIVETRWDLPFKGRPDTVRDFKLHLLAQTAEIGHDLTDPIIRDNAGKVPTTINLFREYQGRAFANNAFFVYLNTGAVPAGMDVGMALSYIKFTVPAYTTIFTYLDEHASEDYNLANAQDSLDVFYVADLDNSYSGSNIEDAVERKRSL